MTQTLEILDCLVGFPTVSCDSNLDIIAYIDDYLQTRGFRVHRVPSPCGSKSGLFASIGPTSGAGIMLSAHTDVVPVAGQPWSSDPFRLTRKGDKFYGRGTTDMKGYVACVMALADKAASAALHEPLKIAFSYDEEVGCIGIQHMIGELESTIGLPRACIVGEPTQMQIAVGHKGKVALTATCKGQNGHSALAPRFVNALHLASDFIVGLRALQDDLAVNAEHDTAFDIPYSTVHVGQLNGGIALNIVPDTALLKLEYRHLVTDSASHLLDRIKQVAQASVASYQQQFPDASIEVEQYNAYPGLEVAATSDVVSLVQGFSRTQGSMKVAFGTEAGVFDQLGIPTIVCGPGYMEGQGHKPDEFVELKELQACDAMLDRVLGTLTA